MKKVFSADKCLKDLEDKHLKDLEGGYVVSGIITFSTLWIGACDGFTKSEMKFLGIPVHDEWMIEIEEDE